MSNSREFKLTHYPPESGAARQRSRLIPSSRHALLSPVKTRRVKGGTPGIMVCPSLARNGTIQTYAKIAHDCVSTIRGWDNAAGPCPGAADSGSPTSTQSTRFHPGGSGQNAEGSSSQEDSRDHEKCNRSNAQDPERKGELCLGDEDRRRSSEARREYGGGSGDRGARIQGRSGRQQTAADRRRGARRSHATAD